MKKILLIILFALLSACAAPPIAIPIQTPSPTLTPTSTPLPPTPDLDNLILSDETLSTADDEIPRYKITDTGWESIPPEELRDELSTLEGWDYARRTDGNLQIIDIDGTPLWTKTGEFWTVLPSDLPIEWSLGDDEKSILNKKGDAIYMLDVEKLAWVEAVKEYPLIPEIDDFRKSYIPEEELFNGDYYIWLLSITDKAEFDLDKITYPEMTLAGGGVMYTTPNNFIDKGTEHFDREVTFAYTTHTTEDGKKLEYIVMPVFFRDENTGEIYPVITIHALYNPNVNLEPVDAQRHIDIWQEKMNITFIKKGVTVPFSEFEDPIVARTFQNHPDMRERFEKFRDGDASALSDLEDPIVLLSEIGEASGGAWLQSKPNPILENIQETNYVFYSKNYNRKI